MNARYPESSPVLSYELERELRFEVDFPALPGIHLAALRREKEKPIDAVPTPFPTLNMVCRGAGGGVGFARSTHNVLAARTGFGKSALGANWAVAAMAHGEKVHYLSLEMIGSQIETRILAIAGDVPLRKLEQGHGFDPEAFEKATDALQVLAERGDGFIHVNQEPLACLDDVLGAMELAHARRKSRFFVIDYLQLAAADPNDPASITEVSHEIRRLAYRLDVTTLVLSQFNRATSAAKNERPTMFGLFGGSAIENDSDTVTIIDHSRIRPAPPPLEGWFGYLVIEKNRHGPGTEVPIHFDTRTLRVRELMPDEER